MLLILKNIMPAEDVAKIRQTLESTKFIDGAISGKQSLKNNMQADRSDPNVEKAIQRVLQALMSQPDFVSYSIPKQVTLEFNRYEKGMFYKDHMDAALMGGIRRQPLRTDLSFTVFLTDPSEYEGGELVLQTPFGEQRVKESAGNAILYPSDMVHRVEPITSGARWGAIGWIQCMIRSDAHRQIVYEIDKLRKEVVTAMPDSELQERFDWVRENLVRTWAEV